MTAMGQKKVETVSIKTNTYCDHCKKCESCGQKIEHDLVYVKGIKRATFNESDTSITVMYKTSKITVETIREEIALLGFDADDIPADPDAYEKLDGCCKK